MTQNRRLLRSAVILSAGMFFFGLVGISESLGAVAALTRTHSGGGVTVKVTYLSPQGSEGPRFEVVLDTHSVDLDAYDLKGLSLLRDERGKAYQPTQVENKGGGHHREITLGFPQLPSSPRRLELVIKDIAGVKERVFRWEF